jgi:hypothetical protein
MPERPGIPPEFTFKMLRAQLWSRKAHFTESGQIVGHSDTRRVIISTPMPMTSAPQKALSIHETAYFSNRTPGTMPQKIHASMNSDF